MKKSGERIDEELVCADSLKNYLEKRGCKAEARREENDPPDFWFTIDGKEFPVEVTSITSESENASLSRLKKLITEINEKVEPDGIYAMQFWGRDCIPQRRSFEWDKLVQEAVSFINSNLEEKVLEKSRDNSIEIKKLSTEGSIVSWMWFPPMGFYIKELQELLKDRIEKKKEGEKLQKVVREHGEAILVFYDAYGYISGKKDIREIVLNTPDHDWFHSVFWAFSFTDRPNELSPNEPGRVGEMIYSKNKEWMPERIL